MFILRAMVVTPLNQFFRGLIEMLLDNSIKDSNLGFRKGIVFRLGKDRKRMSFQGRD